MFCGNLSNIYLLLAALVVDRSERRLQHLSKLPYTVLVTLHCRVHNGLSSAAKSWFAATNIECALGIELAAACFHFRLPPGLLVRLDYNHLTGVVVTYAHEPDSTAEVRHYSLALKLYKSCGAAG